MYTQCTYTYGTIIMTNGKVEVSLSPIVLSIVFHFIFDGLFFCFCFQSLSFQLCLVLDLNVLYLIGYLELFVRGLFRRLCCIIFLSASIEEKEIADRRNVKKLS